MALVTLDGADTVLKNFNKEIGRIKKGSEKGLIRALIQINQAAIPLTPVEFGVLRNSQYRAIIERTDRILGEIGYRAKYAVFVHENLEASHPVGQARFLAEAIRIKQQRVIAEIDGAIAL